MPRSDLRDIHGSWRERVAATHSVIALDAREFARKLRGEATAAEAALWRALRDNARGVKFRRQHPIGKYVVDFYCHSAKLVVELDGGSHDERDHRDAARDEWLRSSGLCVLRFRNEEWNRDRKSVMHRIDAAMASRLPVGTVLDPKPVRPKQVPRFARDIIKAREQKDR